MYSYIRDEDGTRTGFKDGDRFVYCHPFDISLSRRQTIHGYPCVMYHQGRNRSNCKSCNLYGHKAGDQQCPIRNESINLGDGAITNTNTAEDHIVSYTDSDADSIDDNKGNKENPKKNTELIEVTGKENTSQSNVGECVRQASRKNAKESKDAMVIRPTNPGGGSSIETKQEKQMNQGNSSKVYADQQKTKALKDFSYSSKGKI